MTESPSKLYYSDPVYCIAMGQFRKNDPPILVPYLVQVYTAKENQAVEERRKINLIHIHHRDAHGEIGIILKQGVVKVERRVVKNDLLRLSFVC